MPAPLVANLTHCGVGADGLGGLASRTDGFESDTLLDCRSQSRPSYAHGRTRRIWLPALKTLVFFRKNSKALWLATPPLGGQAETETGHALLGTGAQLTNRVGAAMFQVSSLVT